MKDKIISNVIHVEIPLLHQEHLKCHVMAVHDGQNNNKCDYCGKSLAHSNCLKNDTMAIHEGQKKL